MQTFRYSLLLVAVLALAATAHARHPTGTLAGVVLDAQGKPQPGASVTVQTSDGAHPHATRTDAAGHFQFVRFSRGQYDLRAFAQGKSSDWMLRILVRSGKATEITVRLKN